MKGDTKNGFRLGDWQVHPLRNLLVGPPGEIHIEPRVMQVLEHLARAPGQVVERDRLLNDLWDGRAFSDEPLTRCIAALRHALGDSAKDPAYIQTIPKSGYRLICTVEPLGPSTDKAEADLGKPSATRRLGLLTGSRRMEFTVIALLCAAVILFAYNKWWTAEPPVTAIAVLPLENLSNDPEQEYFAVGMTDVLTDTLAQVDGLLVVSRISARRYKTRDQSLAEIAGELNVDAIVDGSVQPTEDRIRLTLQLVDGRTDRNLWSNSYYRDLGDVLTLQGEIARAIADEIQITLDPKTEARLTRDRSATSDAVKLWVLGNHHLKYFPDTDSLDKALQAFTDATDLAPDFAPGYAGMAHIYLILAGWNAHAEQEHFLPLARSAAQQSLELDPYLADAHFALAEIHRFDWEWEAADREFRAGKELNPNDSYGLAVYVNFLSAMGRFEEAIEIGQQAVAVDPYWVGGHAEMGHAFWLAGRDDDALRKFERSLQLLGGDSWAIHDVMAYVHIKAGRYSEALQHLEKIGDKLVLLPPVKLGRVGKAFGLIGQHDKARHILSVLQERRETEHVPAIALAYLYIGLEDYDEAINWLEAAYEERSDSLSFINQYPSYDPIRDDPRFKDIVARMNFPNSN